MDPEHEPTEVRINLIVVLQFISMHLTDSFDRPRRLLQEQRNAPSKKVLFPGFNLPNRFKNVLNLPSPDRCAALPYRWRQTLQDVDIVVPIPNGTKARELSVEIKKTKLKAGFKGKEPIMEVS